MARNYAIEIRLLGYGSDRPLRYFKELASSYHSNIFGEDASPEEINEIFEKLVSFVRNLEKEL